ncbi:hypothetical protein L6164_017467 [Bauhinia variegata]|uniref:Uncharacterized protein n=1 Tax=Bauhinia variegata TaxID=167791 RepID=A0ACB9NCZ4_BAUVA|nr:hypothetical protein L6164_017467 [Bauhinia variegata]
MKQKQLMVLPVFYKVEPSDVRHQKGVFGKIFNKKIEKRFKNNTEKVQRWISTLNAAAELSGWHLEGHVIEYKFIDHIVNDIFKRTTPSLSNGCITLDRQFEEFRSLRYLKLSGNKSLTQVPDISKAPNLEKLWLDNCLNLSEVHDSVGKLSRLTGLHVAGCSKLSSFPDHVMMESLETLDLSSCSSLKTFPEISGMMENLIVIKLNKSGIESIPFSIQNLPGLQRIELEGCKRLSWLPSSILTLPKLDRLCVLYCRDRDLYFDCNSKEKEQQKRISPLERSHEKFVYLSNCNLRDEFLPTRLPCLSDWAALRLKLCDFKILPASIKQFPFLERLQLIQCKTLEEIKALPPSLKKLELSGCEQLREIGELPPNIEEIFAWNCTLLSSKSRSRLLDEKFHEVRAKFIILPREGIPKWFDYCYKGPSLSFWFQNKFPSVALCAVVSSSCGIDTLVLIVNGFQKISRNIEFYDRPSQNHILMFDLKTQIGRVIDGIMIEHGWNHVEISCIEQGSRNAFLGLKGVYLYKQSTNMDDMSFTRPNWPAKRKFDDFEVQNDPYMKYHPALLDRLDNVLPTWFFNHATPIIWEAIWNMQAPPTIRILLWEICQHNLPTCQSLLRRKLIDSPLCPICKEEDETLEHVFLLCPWTRPIWFESEFQWIIDANSLKCFEVWLCQRLKIIKRVHPNFNQVNVLLGCICWAI